jgi:hypothetical protein
MAMRNAWTPWFLFSNETREPALVEEKLPLGIKENFPRRYYPDRVRGYLLSPTLGNFS